MCAGRGTSSYVICLTDIQISGQGFGQRWKVSCSVISVTDIRYITSVFVKTVFYNIIFCVCEHTLLVPECKEYFTSGSTKWSLKQFLQHFEIKTNKIRVQLCSSFSISTSCISASLVSQQCSVTLGWDDLKSGGRTAKLRTGDQLLVLLLSGIDWLMSTLPKVGMLSSLDEVCPWDFSRSNMILL